LVPVCPDFSDELDGPHRAEQGGGDLFDALARAIGPTPVWLFQGALDEHPPAVVARRLVGTLSRYSPEVRYTEYRDVGHNAWDPAYAEPDVIPWLLGHSRNG